MKWKEIQKRRRRGITRRQRKAQKAKWLREGA